MKLLLIRRAAHPPAHPHRRCPYPVADRAAAVVAFLDAARADPSMITAPLIYMVESDYVFMAPLDLPPKGEGAHAGEFSFSDTSLTDQSKQKERTLNQRVNRPTNQPTTDQ